MFCLACCPLGFYAAAQQAPSHHAPDGFRSNYPHPPKQSLWRWKWRIDARERFDVMVIGETRAILPAPRK